MSEYTATVDTDVKSWAGDRPPAATSWRFTTGQGTRPVVSSRTPSPDATAVATDATGARDLRPAPGAPHGERRDGGAAARARGRPVAARVDYLPATRTVRLTPAAPLRGVHVLPRDPEPRGSAPRTARRPPATRGRSPPAATWPSPGASPCPERLRCRRPRTCTSPSLGPPTRRASPPPAFGSRARRARCTPASVSYDPASQTATLHPDSTASSPPPTPRTSAGCGRPTAERCPASPGPSPWPGPRREPPQVTRHHARGRGRARGARRRRLRGLRRAARPRFGHRPDLHAHARRRGRRGGRGHL